MGFLGETEGGKKLMMPTANEKKTEILNSIENKTVVAFPGSVKDWH